jgi:SAM-dependent methyltransferase
MGPIAFTHVDQSDDRNALVDYLDATKSVPVVREAERLLLAELRLCPGARVLDVGCGTGDDAVEIAGLVGPQGTVIGVDASASMVAEARGRAAGRGLPVAFLLCSAERLDLPDASVDACRFERVLQHVDDPGAALGEAMRVLHPGGQVAALEPDWTRLEVAGPEPEITRHVLDARQGLIPHPGIGADLAGLIGAAGFVELRELTLTFSGCQSAARRWLRLDAHAIAAVASGILSQAEHDRWLADVDRACANRSFGVRTSIHLAAGTKPVSGQ